MPAVIPRRSMMLDTDAHVRKLCDTGHLTKALAVVYATQLQGYTASQDTICHVLKVCIAKKDLKVGRQVQSLMLENGLQSVSSLGDHLIRLFASCGSLSSASDAFHKVKEPTIYTWNAIISAHVQLGEGRKALEFLLKMQQVGTIPDVVTFLCVVKACAGAGDLAQGREIHGLFIRHELQSSAFTNSLIDMYAKCGSLEDAHCVFDRLHSRSIVSWGALLGGYVENGDACSTFKLFEQMQKSGLEPNRAVYLCILKACNCVGSLNQGMLVHYEVIKHGLDSDLMVCNTLMDFYVKLSCLGDALKVFDRLVCPDVVSWDIRITGLAENGFSFAALESYEKMQLKGLKPDKYTYSCILKACATEGVVAQGKLIHEQVLRCGLESNIVLANTIVDMYGKCAWIGEACKVFYDMTSRDVVSWSTIIARCVEHGFDGLALLYFERMQQGEVCPNKVVFVCALKACVSAGNLVLGRVLHDLIIKGGFELDLNMGSTLVNMYGNHGSLEEAGFVLHSMKDSNEVTWGLMITACVQHSHFHAAVGLLRKMLHKGMDVDKASFVVILRGCSKSGAIIYGRLLHVLLTEIGYVDDEVQSALIDMYAKCGSCYDASKVSEGSSPGKNVAFWDTKITSFACTDHFEAVQHCSQTVAGEAVKPDRMLFLDLLSACSGARVFKEGSRYLASMKNDCGREPGIDEYNALVDLLGRVGLVEEAEALLLSMPCSPDLVGWMSLLSRCKSLFNIGLARRSFYQISRMDPNDASSYVLMASICADAHMRENLIDKNLRLHQAGLIKTNVVSSESEQVCFLPQHVSRKLNVQLWVDPTYHLSGHQEELHRNLWD